MDISCSICIESFKPESNVSTTRCGHVFHTKCITTWLQHGKTNCPQCRKICRVDENIKTFFSHNESKENILKLAAQNGHWDVYERIMDLFEDKNPIIDDGWLSFHLAAKTGHMKICKIILDAVQDKNPKGKTDWTPLSTWLLRMVIRKFAK